MGLAIDCAVRVTGEDLLGDEVHCPSVKTTVSYRMDVISLPCSVTSSGQHP